jgi:DNA-binding transcriptional MocR family regulator
MPIWKPRRPREPQGRAEPLFRWIVQSLADDIGSGLLPPGARLPPHRDLADDMKLARGTVARAYREAEQLGLIQSDVGRGSFVLAPDGGDRPYSSLLEAPTALSDLSTNLPLSGIDPDPADVLKRLAERPDRRALLTYHPPEGLKRHRLAGVRWLGRMGVDAPADRILTCAGAQHALFVTLAVMLQRRGAIYVEPLTYPGLHGIAESLRRPLIPVTMDGEGMIPAALESAAKKHGPGAVYLMPSIHNPTGAVMSESRRRELARLLERLDLYAIEDAANAMLLREPESAILRFAPERAVLVASVSKVLSPGLRVAFLLAPRSLIPALARQIWATSWMVSPIGAELVTMWLEEGVVDRTVERKRREGERRQRLARRVFAGHEIDAHPSSLHLWLSLPKRWAADRLADEARAQQIVVTPSSAFWVRKTPPPRAIRIALGGADDIDRLESGLQRLARVIRGPLEARRTQPGPAGPIRRGTRAELRPSGRRRDS